MGLKKIIFGDPENQGMKYRLRVFDHGHFLKSATVPNRGQDKITLTVKGKEYGFLGEEVKLAFLINPEIPPHYFGNIAEIDFDVRDSTQLGDIFDICPDLVYELNQSYHATLTALRKDKNVIDAEFTEKTEKEGEETEKGNDPAIIALTDPKTEPIRIPKKELSDLEKNLEKIPGVRNLTSAADTAVQIPQSISKNLRGLAILREIKNSPDEKKQEKIKAALEFCSIPGNQKCLRWLPKYLHIEPEITAIVSQTELDGVGIMPMYYIKQSTAEISEKILARPHKEDDWKMFAIMIIGIIAVLGLIVGLIYIITH